MIVTNDPVRESSGVSYIDTLAACYAEAGDFDEAVKYENQTIQALLAKHEDSKGEAQRLELYNEHKAFREELKH